MIPFEKNEWQFIISSLSDLIYEVEKPVTGARVFLVDKEIYPWVLLSRGAGLSVLVLWGQP